jgi:hypothetical protein
MERAVRPRRPIQHSRPTKKQRRKKHHSMQIKLRRRSSVGYRCKASSLYNVKDKIDETISMERRFLMHKTRKQSDNMVLNIWRFYGKEYQMRMYTPPLFFLSLRKENALKWFIELAQFGTNTSYVCIPSSINIKLRVDKTLDPTVRTQILCLWTKYQINSTRLSWLSGNSIQEVMQGLTSSNRQGVF